MRLSATVGFIGQGWLAVCNALCNAEIEIAPHSDKRNVAQVVQAENPTFREEVPLAWDENPGTRTLVTKYLALAAH
jgi:hypothetical protein